MIPIRQIHVRKGCVMRRTCSFSRPNDNAQVPIHRRDDYKDPRGITGAPPGLSCDAIIQIASEGTRTPNLLIKSQ